MDLRQLRAFCAVVEKGSFTLAAQALRLSQPSVSFQIHSLEQELGTTLFDRQSRQTTITTSGKMLYEYARRILKLCDEAEQAIDDLKGLARGKIIIGASTIPGEYILPDLLQRFRDSYPGIQVELLVGDTECIVDKVLDNEVELGVVGARRKSSKLTFGPFATDRLVLIAPASNKWFDDETATLEKLKMAPFVMRESGSGTRTIVSQKLQQMGLTESELNTVMVLGSTTAVKRAVESGAGVSIVSERAVRREIDLGSVRKLRLDGLDLDRDFFIVYRSGRTLPPAVAALLNFFNERNADL